MDSLKGHPLEAFDRSIDVHISRIRALIEDDPKDAAPRPHGARRRLRVRAQAGRRGRLRQREEPLPPHLRHGGGGAAAVRLRLGLRGRAAHRPGAAAQRIRGERAAGGLGRPDPALAARRRRAAETQAAALREWSQRLRFPLALDDANGQRIGASDSFTRRVEDGTIKPFPVKLDDGRTLWTFRPGQLRQGARRGGRRRPAAAAAAVLARAAGQPPARRRAGDRPGGAVHRHRRRRLSRWSAG